MKEEIRQLRQEIAALEKEQINMKAQRKTVNLKVERTISQYEAAEKVRTNRRKLRVMYAAYGLMRGKTFEIIENRHDSQSTTHPLIAYCRDINKVLNKYGYEMEHKTEKTWYGSIDTFEEGCDPDLLVRRHPDVERNTRKQRDKTHGFQGA